MSTDTPKPDRSAELRMYIVIRTDLGMPVGKLAVQVGHAVASTILKAASSIPDRVRTYMEVDQAKISVRVDSEAALQRAFAECEAAGLPCEMIQDAGRTVFPEPTLTVMAVGPCLRAELPNFVRRLRLFE